MHHEKAPELFRYPIEPLSHHAPRKANKTKQEKKKKRKEEEETTNKVEKTQQLSHSPPVPSQHYQPGLLSDAEKLCGHSQ
jgi:hypothetical protein